MFGSRANYPDEAINYWLAIAGLMLNQDRLGLPSQTADAPPTTKLDFLTELFVAHNLVLERQAAVAASTGGFPGTQQGVVSSKSVGAVSISYTVAEIAELNSGYWAETTYGLRFLRFVRFFGAGPVQIGIGGGGSIFSAWAGPWPLPQPGDTGF